MKQGPRNRKTRKGERGIALSIALILLLVVSTLAVAMLFNTQTSVWTSYNYRRSLQTRYAAEAGAQWATNYLSHNYSSPSGGFASPYNVTVFPATYSSNPIVLASTSAATNYDTSSGMASAFQSAASSASSSFATQSNIPGVGFTVNAQLLSVSPVTEFPSGTGNIVRWKVVSKGTLAGNNAATSQVTEIASNSSSPIFNYALFATKTGCSSISMSNNSKTNSYDSSVNPNPSTFQNSGGSVGSNGNTTIVGGATVNGNVAAGYSGSGTSCSSSAPNGADTNNGGSYTGSLTTITPPQMPPVTLPAAPSGGYPVGPCTANPACNNSWSSGYTMPPGFYGDVGFSNGATIQLQAGTYVMNSLYVGGGITVRMPTTGAVTIYIVGANESNGVPPSTPINFSNGTIANSGGIPSNLVVMYGGTGQVQLGGGTSQYAVVYAPNAPVAINNNNALYGAVVGSTINFAGGAAVHYDRSLANNLTYVTPTLTLESFSWNSY